MKGGNKMNLEEFERRYQERLKELKETQKPAILKKNDDGKIEIEFQAQGEYEYKDGSTPDAKVRFTKTKW
tara:strand:+ start:361 stop:570 length:210 start_codon:yes stop_codon:yes gene_type:complete